MQTGAAGGLSPLTAGSVVAAVSAGSMLVGRRNAPDPSHPAIRRWYNQLSKPGFTPPDAVFAVVWPLLETGLAVGGYRMLRTAPSASRNASVGLWLITAGLIGGWTELFFRKHAIGSSAVASGAMLLSAAGYVVATHKVDRLAQRTAMPLVAWLGFATVLTTCVWQRNRPAPGTRAG
jgi:translocator protein